MIKEEKNIIAENIFQYLSKTIKYCFHYSDVFFDISYTI